MGEVENGREYGFLREAIKEHIVAERERSVKNGESAAFDGRRIQQLLDRSEGFLSSAGVNYLGYVKAYYTTMAGGGLVAAIIGVWLLACGFTQRPYRRYGRIFFGGWLSILGTYAFVGHVADAFHVWLSPTTYVMSKTAQFWIPLLSKFFGISLLP